MSDENNTLELATELTVAWLGNPHTRAGSEDVPAFLRAMYDVVSTLVDPVPTGTPDEAGSGYPRAVSVRKSLARPDAIISMIDGKPYKTLRRHLAGHGLTADEYRARYNLKPDYPMVAPEYSEARRAMAKTLGLGRKTGPSKKGTGKASGPSDPATKTDRRSGGDGGLAAAKAHLGSE